MAAAPRTILILQDNPQFGGHEIMLLGFLPAVLASPDIGRVVFAYPESNPTLDARLRAITSSKLELRPWGWTRRGGEPYRADLRFGYKRAVRSLYKEVKPDAVLLIQGRIENCVVPTLALPRDALLVSYIPLAHSMAEIGRNPIGDWPRRRLYRRPNRFIVPSASIGGQLGRAGATAPVTVAENVVHVPPAPDQAAARAALNLPADRRIAMFLGRFDVAQKGLDRLADAIRRAGDGLTDWTLLFVGDGEGKPLIEGLAADLAGRVDIRLHGFSNRPQDYLAAADLLMLPSRWEGVPLVMLEAMQIGLPILASGIDVFTEYLPPANRMDYEAGDLATALAGALAPVALAAYKTQAEAVTQRASPERSATLFLKALLP